MREENKRAEDLNNIDYDKEKLTELLLRPIVCSRKCKSIKIENGIISTGQEFYTKPDEDMSDIAIVFYEIIYSKVLNGAKLLTKNEKTKITDISNCCFAGDTMNSFNTIANFIKREHKELSKEDRDLLEKYQKKYHCLANFWILPACLGRRSKKGNNLDSMDIFLNGLEKDYDGIVKKHKSYYAVWSDFSNFRKDHFLGGYEKINTSTIRTLYAEKDVKNLINTAITRIERRAKDISESDIGKELWNYFCEHNLVS